MPSKKTPLEVVDDISDDDFSDGSGSLSSDGDFSEDDQNDAMEEVNEHEQVVTSHPAKKIKPNSKFDLPNKEEQMHLRETQNLMTSNLLHLQVDEMLNEVHDQRSGKLTSKRKALLSWLTQFQSTLSKVSMKGGAEVTSAWLEKHNISHIHLENYTAQTSLTFHSPTEVTQVGSFPLQTATKPYTNIDIVVKMPHECFTPRDILNHVYFDKRKLYLGVIVKHLKSSSSKFKDTVDVSSINISFLKGDTRKPIITLKPNMKTSYVIRIIPAAPEHAFKLSQLRPQKNNVRPSRWLQMVKTSALKESEWDLSSLRATPHYNLAILEDLALISQHNIVERVLDSCPCARDATVIAKVWLTQRGYRFGLDSLDGHGVALLVAYLFQQRTINAQMSSFTVFQCLLKFLSETDFSQEHLSFVAQRDEAGAEAKAAAAAAAAAVLHFPLQDDKGKTHVFNVFWRWSASFVDEVRDTARVSLVALQDSGGSNAFNQVFMTSPSFFKKYDLVFHIPVLDKRSFNENFKKLKAAVAASGAASATAAEDAFLVTLGESSQDQLHDLSAWQAGSRAARELIVKALGDRAVKVHTMSTPLLSPLNSSRYARPLCSGTAHYPQLVSDQSEDSSSLVSLEDMAYITVGILISTAEGTTRRVDRGPSASEEAECAKFSEFWGSKCRLRRFRDGTIVEAVVWGEQDPGAVQHADALIGEIVQYSVSRHMHFHLLGRGGSNGAGAPRVMAVSNQLAQFLPLTGRPSDDSSESQTVPSALTRSLTRGSDSGTLFRKAVEALDALRKILTAKISDFPLIFESFSGAHAALRYTSFIPPTQHPIVMGTKQALNELSNKKITRMIEPLNVIGSLSNSSRWPTDLNALRTAKTALIIRLSKCIKKQFELKSMIHRDYLDIFYQGFVFRLQLYTDQELLLLTGSQAHLTLTPSKAPVQQTFRKFDNEEACQLHRRMVLDPLHHAAVRGLSSRFSAFGDTVRLVLCWRDNHMLSNHLPQELVELVVASVFTEKMHLTNNDELPCTNVPQSPTVSFLRTLIRLSQFNWSESILLVDFLTYVEADDAQVLEKTKGLVRDMNSRFRAVKAAGHEHAMTVGAQYDEYNGFSVVYGVTTPDKALVGIIAGMAKSSADLLIEWMSSPTPGATSAVMRPVQSLAESCNVILQFRSAVVCGKRGRSGEVDWSGDGVMNDYVKGPASARMEIFSNISSQEKSGDCLIGRNTPLPHPLQVEALSILTEEFSHVAIFFFNNLRGDQVGVRWKPNAFLPARFSMLQCRHHYISSAPTAATAGAAAGSGGGGGGGVMVLNAAAVVAEMVQRCHGLVEAVSFI